MHKHTYLNRGGDLQHTGMHNYNSTRYVCTVNAIGGRAAGWQQTYTSLCCVMSDEYTVTRQSESTFKSERTSLHGARPIGRLAHAVLALQLDRVAELAAELRVQAAEEEMDALDRQRQEFLDRRVQLSEALGQVCVLEAGAAGDYRHCRLRSA